MPARAVVTHGRAKVRDTQGTARRVPDNANYGSMGDWRDDGDEHGYTTEWYYTDRRPGC